MRAFTIYTRHHGNHEVKAETARQAVACVVARLKLTEQEAAQVIRWAVSSERAADAGQTSKGTGEAT